MSNADFLPGFSFSADVGITDDQFKEETKRTENRIPLYQKVALQVLAVKLMKANDNDPTWVNGTITLGLPGWKDSGETEITKKGTVVPIFVDEKGKKVFPMNHFIMVPTQKVYFTSAKGENVLMPFQNLQRMFASMGVELKPSNLAEAIPFYFSESGKNLIGQTLYARCGYRTAHIGYTAETEEFTVNNRAGIAVELPEGKENKFASREEAMEAGLDAGMEELLEASYPEILKFFPAKSIKPFSLSEKVAETNQTAADATFDD